ncbi:MAG: hypothetical protein Kow0098_14100 [Ignavibacteriaceae bacterium]
MRRLQHLLEESARKFPDKIAIEELNGRKITYSELNGLADEVKIKLQKSGISEFDRVGIYSHKNIDMVISVFGILKAGATYVPVDPGSPPARNAFIMNDCLVKGVILEENFISDFKDQLKAYDLKVNYDLTGTLKLLDGPGKFEKNAESENDIQCDLPDDSLAYILYTSGSTGNPKGVKYSHYGALAFIDWCSETFAPEGNDRFSSHAPFHFDLSIHDLYVSLKHGATLVLIDEETGKQPMILAEKISEKRISIWYSTPSILTLLVKFGKLEKYDYSELRIIHFAGEVFPVKHLRDLKKIWNGKTFYNLYGPTETNVCTYYKIPDEIPDDRIEPFPIGKNCSHLKTKVFDSSGTPVEKGKEGELCVSGLIMQGYWNLPEKNKSVFFNDSNGTKWYRTGDIVIENSDGNYIYVSRKDRMVKRRGYRVELGEIETALYKHPSVLEAAAVSTTDKEGGVIIKAFLCMLQETEASVIKMKKFCSENLPQYMIPDRFSFRSSLPKTSTNKIDYQKLKEL